MKLVQSNGEEEQEEQQQDEKVDKLLKIQEDMEIPVGLSDLEKEKISKTFEALKEWLGDTEVVVLEKPRVEAYRLIKLVIAHLQMADADYVAGASRPSVVIDPVGASPQVAPDHVEKSAIKSPKVVRPTKEQVDGWLEDMNPRVRSKLVRLLDCFKQYLDPENEGGIDIICNHCTPDEIVKCIRGEDPTIVDASTVFMKHQLGR